MISVHDKSNIVDFAGELEKLGIEITATSGTFKTLKNDGVCSVKKISGVTEFPEIFGGKEKAGHPRIMGGISSLIDDEELINELKGLGIKLVDIVVCNLYPRSRRSRI